MKRRNLLLGLLAAPVAAVAAPVTPDVKVLQSLNATLELAKKVRTAGRGQTSVLHHIDECAFYQPESQTGGAQEDGIVLSDEVSRKLRFHVYDADICSMYWQSMPNLYGTKT